MRKILIAVASIDNGKIEKKAAINIWPIPVIGFAVSVYKRVNWKAVFTGVAKIMMALFWLCMIASI